MQTLLAIAVLMKTGLAKKGGERAARAAVLGLVLAAAPALAADPPRRVVSLNVCTDQLAMLVAAKGQLRSVSFLARDPLISAMAEEAANYPVNHGQAEEVFLLKPDLVLAGTYTAQATVTLLKSLGFRVEQFSPESSFDDVRANLRRMGALLGREERAEALVAELDAGLAQAAQAPASGKTAALYYANGYTSGADTLADAAIAAAGLSNLAARLGIRGTGVLPLEALVMADPDVVATGDRDYSPPALAQENFSHPAFRALALRTGEAAMPVRYTVCGGPFTLAAVEALRAAAGPERSQR